MIFWRILSHNSGEFRHRLEKTWIGGISYSLFTTGSYFFDTSSRKILSLYRDECLYGLRGFYFTGSKSWEPADFNQVNAFRGVVQGKMLPANGRMKKNPDNSSIKLHEVEAILLVSQICAPTW